MAIITISRGSFSFGRTIAEQVASRLGFECISREVLLEASDRFNIPEIKLEHAISDAPSILDRFRHGKQNYVAFFQSALASHVCKDNIVYHGLAGHVLLRTLPHVLKVRIIADMETRTGIVMRQEEMGKRQALAHVRKLDLARRRWTRSLFGVDPWDSALYDLTINTHNFKEAEAVELVCAAAGMERFKSTDESRRQAEDLALACRVKAALVERFPDISVASHYGNVLLYNQGKDRLVRRLRDATADLRESIEGINNIEVHAGISPPENAV